MTSRGKSVDFHVLNFSCIIAAIVRFLVDQSEQYTGHLVRFHIRYKTQSHNAAHAKTTAAWLKPKINFEPDLRMLYLIAAWLLGHQGYSFVSCTKLKK
jgi:hypothetical protein